MTSNMPTEDSSQVFARSLFSMLQSGGVNFVNSHRLSPDILVDGMKNKLLGGYNCVQHAMSRYLPHAALRAGTPESVDLESAPDSNQQVTDTSRGHPFRNHNNPFTSDGDDWNVEVDQTATGEEYSSDSVRPEHPKRSWMWMAALVVGLLLLILTPGLILGVVTRQVAWGIAISGAVAPAVVFFGGLYYHHNK